MKTTDISHHVQKQIFNRLVSANELRYSELKPKDLEANAFMYHLNELIKTGLVTKQDKKYALSKQGKLYATRFSIRESGLRIMPTTLSVIKLDTEDGKTLLYKRKRQPYIDALGFASGKIHYGETLEKAAYRELEEKCGYKHSDVRLELKGEFSIVSKAEGAADNHVLGHLWQGKVKDCKVHENHAGVTYWADWEQEDYKKFIFGFKEITQACELEEKFILDLEF